MNQEKYVTRKKRIRQLEKKISELEHKIETLTELLDCVHQMLYTTRPRLARSMALEFERIHPDITTPVVKKEKRRLPNISIAPRADLVTERDSNGRLIIKSKP